MNRIEIVKKNTFAYERKHIVNSTHAEIFNYIRTCKTRSIASWSFITSHNPFDATIRNCASLSISMLATKGSVIKLFLSNGSP